MTVQPQERKQSPIAQANEIRWSLLVSIQNNLPIEFTIPSEIMACIVGMPTYIFNKNFSMLINTQPDGVNILTAPKSEIAMQAFRNWRDDLSDKGKTSYNSMLYRALYEIVQAAALTIPASEVGELPGLLLILESEYDPYLGGVAERYAGKGDMDTEDAKIIHARLRKIWSQLPKGVKDTLKSPDTLFG